MIPFNGGTARHDLMWFLMSWILLTVAGLFEVVWAIALKFVNGQRSWPVLVVAVGLLGSLACLNLSLRSLPLSTAYAVWVGIGATGTAFIGILCFHEAASPLKLASLVLIIAGVVGMKLAP